MIEPLSILLKSIENKPATLLRNRNGKTIARVYDDEYTPLFLIALRLLEAIEDEVIDTEDTTTENNLMKLLADYQELCNIHIPDKGRAA